MRQGHRTPSHTSLKPFSKCRGCPVKLWETPASALTDRGRDQHWSADMSDGIEIIETWKPVVGFERQYEVSSLGRVYSRLSEKILKPRNAAYLSFSLRRDGRSHSIYLHHLVAEAFIGPRPGGQEIRHLNGDQYDNCAVNIGYGTHSQNMMDAIAHGTHPTGGKTHCKYGHEFNDENTSHTTYRTPDGLWRPRRNCRSCTLRLRREYSARLKERNHS